MLGLPRMPVRGLRSLIVISILSFAFVAGLPATATAVLDDALPGVAPTLSPFEASVEATGDVRDVYRFSILEGQFLSAKVAQTSEATAAVAVFRPGTTDLDNLTSAISSATLGPHSSFAADVTAQRGGAGSYFLDVVARSGASTYTVDWSIKNPSFSLLGFSAARTVIKGSAAEDVTFKATWGNLGTTPMPFTSQSDKPWLVTTPATGMASSNTNQQFTLTVDAGALAPGYHDATATVDILGADPKPFRVSVHVLDQPAISVASSTSKVKYGGRTTITGALKTSAGALLPGRKATLQRSYDGVTGWTNVVAPLESATGNYSVSTPVYRNTYFRWVFDGGGDYAPTASVNKRVYSYAYVQRPYVPRHIRPRHTYTFKGSLRPQHTAGSSAIRLYWQYYSRGKWRNESSMSVLVTNYSNYSIYKYRDRYGKNVPRKWRVRAMHSDSSHLKTYSSWRYYSVY